MSAADSAPDLSVLIVNWNRYKDVAETLTVLQATEKVNLELIVVDNGSTDESVDKLGSMDLKLICMGENLGPSVARNVGIQQASGRYILFLDSDAFVRDPTALYRMIKKMDAEPDIGILACQILKDGSDQIDQWIYAQPSKTHRDKEFDTYSFSAAGAMARTDALHKIGGFWEELFMYNEEVDLSIRLIREGYRITYYPDVSIHHRSGPRGRLSTAKYLHLQTRNWLWIYYRHFPTPYRQAWITVAAVLNLLKSISQGSLLAGLRGLREGLKGRRYAKQFPNKLTPSQLSHLYQLNKRRSLHLGRGT